MNSTQYAGNHQGQTLAGIVSEIRDELKEFVQTRVQMVRSELHETITAAKAWVPLAACAVTLLATAYLLFTIAIVALVSMAFLTNPYRWFLSFLIVSVIWATAGSIFAYLAWIQLRAQGTFPKRTIEVLKADGIWLQNEVKNQI
jgi:putative superfamily III holin-X